MKPSPALCLLASGLCLLLTGCAGTVRVPKTDLHVETKAWQVRLRSEKDTQLEGLAVAIQTNGTVTVALPRFTATNSPTVIRETGKAQALTIDAQGRLLDAAGNVVGKIVEGVAVIYGP